MVPAAASVEEHTTLAGTHVLRPVMERNHVGIVSKRAKCNAATLAAARNATSLARLASKTALGLVLTEARVSCHAPCLATCFRVLRGVS